MEFKKIKIENFKKIKKLELDFKNTQIIPIVGLNESGKTTILEAINFINDYEKIINDKIENIIPIDLSSNFNGKILVSYSFLLTKDDITKIKETSFFIDNDLYFLKEEESIEIEFNIGIKYSKSNIEEKIFHISNVNNFFGKRIGIDKIISNLNQIEPNKWFNFFNEFLKNELFQKIIFIPNDLAKVANGIEIENYDKTHKSNINYANEICKKGIEEILKSNNLLNDDESLYNLLEFKKNQKKRYKQIMNNLSHTIIFKFNELWSDILESNTKISLDIKIDEEDKKIKFDILDHNRYDLEKRSEGFKWFFLFVIVSSFYDNKNIIFLLDEPANNLHPIAQEKIIKHFENNLLKNNNKIIYTTHSSYMIKPMFLEGTFVIESDYCDFNNDKNKNIKVVKYKNINNDENESYYKPIIDSLGYKPPFFEFSQNKLAIVVEGKTDSFLFNYLSEKYFLEDKIDLNIIPCKGAKQTEGIISLLMGFKINFIVLYDNDEEGKKNKEDNKKFFENDVFFTYSDVMNIESTFKLENFISKEFWEKNELKTKKQKESFIKDIYEKGYDAKEFDLETKENFQKIWNFLNDKFNLFFNKHKG